MCTRKKKVVFDYQFQINDEKLNVTNITGIKVKNDALQTTIKFTAPLIDDSYPATTLYKDGVKSEHSEMEIQNIETREIEMSFGFCENISISFKLLVTEAFTWLSTVKRQ